LGKLERHRICFCTFYLYLLTLALNFTITPHITNKHFLLFLQLSRGLVGMSLLNMADGSASIMQYPVSPCSTNTLSRDRLDDDWSIYPFMVGRKHFLIAILQAPHKYKDWDTSSSSSTEILTVSITVTAFISFCSFCMTVNVWEQVIPPGNGPTVKPTCPRRRSTNMVILAYEGNPKQFQKVRSVSNREAPPCPEGDTKSHVVASIHSPSY
jgi:hypothetical protein